MIKICKKVNIVRHKIIDIFNLQFPSSLLLQRLGINRMKVKLRGKWVSFETKNQAEMTKSLNEQAFPTPRTLAQTLQAKNGKTLPSSWGWQVGRVRQHLGSLPQLPFLPSLPGGRVGRGRGRSSQSLSSAPGRRKASAGRRELLK